MENASPVPGVFGDIKQFTLERNLTSVTSVMKPFVITHPFGDTRKFILQRNHSIVKSVANVFLPFHALDDIKHSILKITPPSALSVEMLFYFAHLQELQTAHWRETIKVKSW